MARILLVDPDPITAAETAVRLGAAGHQTAVVSNAARALHMVSSGHVEMVIADVHLPRTDGFELRDQLLSSPATAGIRFLFCAAAIDPEECSVAARLGSRIVSKPVDPADLIESAPATLDLPLESISPILLEPFDAVEMSVQFSCGVCQESYRLGGELQDDRLLSMCPSCASRSAVSG